MIRSDDEGGRFTLTMLNWIRNWVEQIQTAQSLVEWRTIRDRFHAKLDTSSFHLESLELTRCINEFHDAMIRRIAYWSIEQVEQELGHSTPSEYAFVLFGSGGRCEQTPWSDQDNGIIYELVDELKQVEVNAFFMRVAVVWSDGLCEVGYPPCVGNVICTNEQWCRSSLGWQQMIDSWWERCHWEDVRYLLITADARVIAGNGAIWQRIRDAYLSRVQAKPELLTAMLRNTLHHKISLGVFGHFLTERYGVDAGGIDLKYGGYIPIVNVIRLLAVRHGIGASSTLERLDGLVQFYSQEQVNAWRETFLVMLFWRSNTPFEIENGVYTSSGKIKVNSLSSANQKIIKKALREGMQMQIFLRQSLNYKNE